MKKILVLLLLLPCIVHSQQKGVYDYLRNARTFDINYMMDGTSDWVGFNWGIGFVNQNNYDQAAQYLKTIHQTQDTAMMEIVNDLLGNIYFLQKDWNSFLQLYSSIPYVAGEDTSVLQMARYYNTLPKEKIKYPSSATLLSFKKGPSGTPMIEVRLNGKKYTFWVDSGAGMSVVSSTVAEKCKIKRSTHKQLVARAATGKNISIDYGMFDSLSFGGITAYNHPCLVIPKEQLEAKILGVRIVKIDGIIGWNLLQEMAVTINYPENKILFEEGGKHKIEKNNLFWTGVPIVKCTSGGKQLYFSFDTGADVTSYYEPLFEKMKFSNFTEREIKIWSAGGSAKVKTKVVPEFLLDIADKRLTIINRGTSPDIQDGFFIIDGMLGSKELMEYTLHFDLRSGVFSLK